MNLPEMRWILSRKGILAEDRKLEYGYNRVRLHSRFETTEHFIAKALLSFKIMNRDGNAILSEAETKNGRILDILQATKNSLVGYEIESTKNRKIDVEGVDIVEIPLSKAPASFKKGIKDMSKFLDSYMV